MASCILVIETSTSRGEVAVLKGDAVVFQEDFASERSHNAQMFGPLGRALEIVGKNLRMVVVGTGPGSYTGVRIGIAAAQGLAWSRGVPVVGLPSVLAVGGKAEAGSLVLCGDARRGLYYVAKVEDGRLGDGVVLMSREELGRLRAEDERGVWLTFDDKPPGGLAGVRLIKPDAARLGSLVANMEAEELRSLAGQPLEPYYLSAPFVTMTKRQANPALRLGQDA